MPNRINYQLEMEKVLRTLDGTRPKLLLHACCAPCSSATLERLAAHFDITILYYNPNIYPPEEYHRREAELERFVEEVGYHYPVVEVAILAQAIAGYNSLLLLVPISFAIPTRSEIMIAAVAVALVILASSDEAIQARKISIFGLSL